MHLFALQSLSGFVLLGLCMLATTTRCLAGESESPDQVRERHRAAVELIRTLSCEFSRDGADRVEKVHGRYWRSANQTKLTYRIRNPQQDAQHEVLITEGRLRSFVHGQREGNKQHGAAIHAQEFEPIHDVWVGALFAIPIPDRPPFRLALVNQALADSASVDRCERIKDGDSESVRAVLSYEHGRVEVFFDPVVNYLVRKATVVVDAPRKITVTREVVRFTEPKPGIFFPAEAVHHTPDGKRQVRWTFSNIRINEPIPADVFRLPLPDETVTSDYIKGTIYRATRRVETWARPRERTAHR